MQRCERVARTVRMIAVGGVAVLLWGALTACETDSWTADKRVDVAPADAAAPAPAALPNAPVTGRTEADLVNELIMHRAMYARHVRVLATFYSEHGYENKASWARAELRDGATAEEQG